LGAQRAFLSSARSKFTGIPLPRGEGLSKSFSRQPSRTTAHVGPRQSDTRHCWYANVVIRDPVSEGCSRFAGAFCATDAVRVTFTRPAQANPSFRTRGRARVSILAKIEKSESKRPGAGKSSGFRAFSRNRPAHSAERCDSAKAQKSCRRMRGHLLPLAFNDWDGQASGGRSATILAYGRGRHGPPTASPSANPFGSPDPKKKKKKKKNKKKKKKKPLRGPPEFLLAILTRPAGAETSGTFSSFRYRPRAGTDPRHRILLDEFPKMRPPGDKQKTNRIFDAVMRANEIAPLRIITRGPFNIPVLRTCLRVGEYVFFRLMGLNSRTYPNSSSSENESLKT